VLEVDCGRPKHVAAVERELRIIRNRRGNVGLAPLLGAWRVGAVTGGFALLNLRLQSVNPPGSTAAALASAAQTPVPETRRVA